MIATPLASTCDDGVTLSTVGRVLGVPLLVVFRNTPVLLTRCQVPRSSNPSVVVMIILLSKLVPLTPLMPS